MDRYRDEDHCYESIGVVFGGGETEVRGERKGEAAEREAKEEA